MNNPPPSYLEDALSSLHDATGDVVRWRLTHRSCGPEFQNLNIQPTEETLETLQSLQDSIKTIAEITDWLRRNDKVPDPEKNDSEEREAAQAIHDVRKTLDGLRDCFQYYQNVSSHTDDLRTRAQEMDRHAKTLRSASAFPEKSASQTFVIEGNSKITGHLLVQVDNKAIGPSSEGTLQAMTTANSEIRGTGSSSYNVENEVVLTDHLTQAESSSFLRRLLKKDRESAA